MSFQFIEACKLGELDKAKFHLDESEKITNTFIHPHSKFFNYSNN